MFSHTVQQLGVATNAVSTGRLKTCWFSRGGGGDQCRQACCHQEAGSCPAGQVLYNKSLIVVVQYNQFLTFEGFDSPGDDSVFWTV